MRCQDGVTAAIDESEHVIMRDFLAKTDATRAENAALVVECYPGTYLHSFRLLHFVFKETRLRIAIVNAEFLQLAFPSLIANRAIKWVVNQEKFHHAVPTFLNQW